MEKLQHRHRDWWSRDWWTQNEGLGARLTNATRHAEIYSKEDLANVTAVEFLRHAHVGLGTVREARDYLCRVGLQDCKFVRSCLAYRLEPRPLTARGLARKIEDLEKRQLSLQSELEENDAKLRDLKEQQANRPFVYLKT